MGGSKEYMPALDLSNIFPSTALSNTKKLIPIKKERVSSTKPEFDEYTKTVLGSLNRKKKCHKSCTRYLPIIKSSNVNFYLKFRMNY